VFPSGPGEPKLPWSRFYAALVNAAAELSRRNERRLIPFYGLDFQPHTAAYAQLVERVETQRLAGIIFASNPFRLARTPILDRDGTPRVAVMSEHLYPRVPAVTLEGSFWPKAVGYLAARARRRIAVLTTIAVPLDLAEVRQELFPLLTEHGLSTRSSWIMPISSPALEGARVCVQALMQAPSAERPDGLIIADDNLVADALAGLAEEGARVGDDLDVVAHCNFPWAGKAAPQLRWLGYDARTVLETCLDLLDRQRRGAAVAGLTKIAAMFEDEVSATNILATKP
jgi:DNA-binding LacI/PurR family transcriptional regulator